MSRNSEPCLPPGFRFHPTDEELILHYLRNRSNSIPCPVSIIAEVDIYKFDPWELPGKAAFGDKEWYFFSPRDRKYPNGARPNRAAASGYWKATGTDKPIVKTKGGKENIGVKKALVFYRGKPPKGIKTNWIMHEYRLAEVLPTNYRPVIKFKDSSPPPSMRLDDWVLCRIYRKSSQSPPPNASVGSVADQEQEEQPTVYCPAVLSHGQRSSPELPKTSSFSDILAATDFSSLTHLLADNPAADLGPAVPHTNQNVPHVAMDNSSSSNNSYTQFLPYDNHLKRHQPIAPADPGEIGAHPFKKFNSSCNLTDTSSSQLDASPYSFLNQQILLNSRFGFQ